MSESQRNTVFEYKGVGSSFGSFSTGISYFLYLLRLDGLKSAFRMIPQMNFLCSTEQLACTVRAVKNLRGRTLSVQLLVW